MSRRRQEFEFARPEQGQLRAELQSRERMYREARLHASQEMEVLRKTHNWKMAEIYREELRESQNAVTQLTAQVQELQRQSELLE